MSATALHSEKGQAAIEFCIMLPFLAMIMVFLITIYDFIDGNITALHTARCDLRNKIEGIEANSGSFTKIAGRGLAYTEIPGKMKLVLGQGFLSKEIKIIGFGGSYQGLHKSQYGTGNGERQNIFLSY